MYTNLIEIKKKKEKFTISLKISEDVIIIKEIDSQELLQIYSEIEKVVKDVAK